MKKNSIAIVGGLLSFFIGIAPVFAAEFAAPNKDGNGNITLSTTETHKNMYVVGGTVTVNSTTQGDLYVAGGTVTVDGPVEQDIAVAGGTLSINNTLGGDLRAVGGTIVVNSDVAGDIVIAGGTVLISEKASVGGDVVVVGGSLELNAQVSGSVQTAGGSITINSKVDGTVNVHSSKEVIFGPNSNVAGKVTVHSQSEARVLDGAKIGTIDFTKQEARSHSRAIAGLVTTGLLIKFFAFLIVALLAVYMWPVKSKLVAEKIEQKAMANIGVGLVTVIVAPVVAVLLFITLVGYYAALLLLIGFILLMLVTCVFSSLFVGSWVIQKLTKRDSLQVDWQAAVLGVVVLMVLGFVPIIGWVIQAGLFLASLGAIVKLLSPHLRENKEA